MADPVTDESLTQMANDIFRLTTMSWRQRLAARQQGEADISESQFLILDTLITRNMPQNVGDLQRGIHVVPAQMSRLIRSLENDFDSPLIRCELNREDKRKIDVHITEAGRTAYLDFVKSRISRTLDILRQLPEKDRLDFKRICGQMRTLYDRNHNSDT